MPLFAAMLVDIIGLLISVVQMLVIVQFILGLLIAFNVVNTHNQFVSSFYNGINVVLDPLLRPIRKIMPNTGAIDFSPLVLILALMILQRVLVYAAYAAQANAV